MKYLTVTTVSSYRSIESIWTLVNIISFHPGYREVQRHSPEKGPRDDNTTEESSNWTTDYRTWGYYRRTYETWPIRGPCKAVIEAEGWLDKRIQEADEAHRRVEATKGTYRGRPVARLHWGWVRTYVRLGRVSTCRMISQVRSRVSTKRISPYGS